ncbi:TetR/AcrR family transcriptional regulator [Kineococcus rhizosphaerae]|uniref:TetR family transcriptional regulator n=1 Tax=Kineococcus rhizosphaerae TaxID=559628 RepID=A0A2T0QP77_9ACTN|nr:TetR/AcrR family transcriptional regulator [Kineococcus rhizosphaerae]PRY06446.1 TetR family transcriptional regulator [Kineococcus rhizosphaerae]
MPLTDDVPVRRRSNRQAIATAERREQILDAAMTAFAEAGYHATSMRDIAGRVALSHTGLLHHFPDKAALLEAVLDRDLERAAVDAMLDPRQGESFLRGLVALAERDARDPERTRFYCVVGAEALTPTHPAHGYFRQWYARVREAVTAALEDLERRGHYTGPAGGIPLAAVHIASMREGLNQHWLLAPDEVDLVAAVTEQLQQYTDLPLNVLHGSSRSTTGA